MTFSEELVVSGMPVTVIRKGNLKNLYIRVIPPEGDVKVSAPVEVGKEEIELFLLKKLPEITKVRDRMLSQERQTKREYVSGESHYLWGKPYRLQVVYSGTNYKVVKYPNKIVLTVPDGATTEARERAITEWYRTELKRVLQTVVAQCENTMGVHAEEFRIKNMRTRWGTCKIENRRIWINLQLVKKPVECLEYVVIHELVHLVEKNHSYRFRALVEKYCPTWKEARRLLSIMPLDFMDKRKQDTDDDESNIERYL